MSWNNEADTKGIGYKNLTWYKDMRPLSVKGLDCINCPPNKGHNRKYNYLYKRKNITKKDFRHRPPNI